MPSNQNDLQEYPFIKSNFCNSQQDLKLIVLEDQSMQFTKTSQDDYYCNNIISILFIDKCISCQVIFEVSYQNQDHFSFFVGLTTKSNTDYLYNKNQHFVYSPRILTMATESMSQSKAIK
ncbi:hypothetical protein ABPG72_020452 [Tetrahymena utriculariae]